MVATTKTTSSPNTPARHIILIGFMGAGKTSVGRRIARLKHLNSIDLDKYIERQEGMRVQDIFATRGELEFRRLELEFLRSMPSREKSILACGGGIVTTPECLELLPKLGCVIYLKVSAQTATKRISNPQSRPLLSNAISPERLLASREPLYLKAAEIVLDTEGLSVKRVAESLISILSERGEL
jgi:shikimate kinase